MNRAPQPARGRPHIARLEIAPHKLRDQRTPLHQISRKMTSRNTSHVLRVYSGRMLSRVVYTRNECGFPPARSRYSSPLAGCCRDSLPQVKRPPRTEKEHRARRPQTRSSSRNPRTGAEKLTFDVEWRLVHAGTVFIDPEKTHAEMKLQSAGLVSSLFKVNDTYTVDYDEPFCASRGLMDSEEGKRHRESEITYDRVRNRASYVERDVLKDVVLHSDRWISRTACMT